MTVEDLEKAVAKLTARELDRFRAWFDEFDSARFDAKIERDVQADKPQVRRFGELRKTSRGCTQTGR
jgi:hypothetical protein